MSQLLILAAAPVGWLDRSSSEVARSAIGLRGAVEVVLVGTADLATARWSHRIVDGVASTTARLKDGTLIDTESVGAVLNRVPSLHPMGFGGSSVRDRAYADAELQALFVSFLRSCGSRVLNGVDGHGPLGLWSSLRWAALAHRCGLETWPDGIRSGTRLPARRTHGRVAPVPAQHVTVVGERVFGATSPDQVVSCLRLADESGCELLGLTFGAGPDPQLLAADPFPPLSGEVGAAVARLLCERATSLEVRAS